MGKKIFNSNIIYFIGMALVIVGLLCPIVKIMGQTPNAFKFLDLKNFGTSTVGILLVCIGAVLGVLFSLLAGFNKTHRLIALAITLAGGVILLLLLTGVLSDSSFGGKIWRAVGESFIKRAYIGFYLILAGWLCAIFGWLKD